MDVDVDESEDNKEPEYVGVAPQMAMNTLWSLTMMQTMMTMMS